MSNIIFPNNVQVIHTWRHGSKEWLIERGFTVGASEIGKALGVSPYGGLLSLVIDKRKAHMGNPDVVSSEAMQDGQDAEATVLRMAWRRLQNIEGGICEATATPEMVPGYPVALGVVLAVVGAALIGQVGGRLGQALHRVAVGSQRAADGLGEGGTGRLHERTLELIKGQAGNEQPALIEAQGEAQHAIGGGHCHAMGDSRVRAEGQHPALMQSAPFAAEVELEHVSRRHQWSGPVLAHLTLLRACRATTAP